jgi:hypothetical protein
MDEVTGSSHIMFKSSRVEPIDIVLGDGGEFVESVNPSPDTLSTSAEASPEIKSKNPSATDLSALPHLLQKSFDLHGSSDSVRPGIIRAGASWTRQRRESLFSPSRQVALNSDHQLAEKQRAFDLLDALTRSGGLPVPDTTVHVLLASSHYFDQSLLDTVIRKNVNPLVKLEESLLLMARVIHEKTCTQDLIESK